MNVYVWQRIANATKNYHTEGGVVAFARDLAEAFVLARAEGAVIGPEEQPDEVRECADIGGPKAYIFPGAGCC